MAAMREIASGLQFPEGPIAMSDGSVILVEIQRGTLSRVDPQGRVEVVGECGGGPNGAAIGPDGAVYVCNNGGFEWHVVAGLTAPGHQPADYIGGRIQRVTLDGKVTDLGKTRERDCDLGGLYYATPDGAHIEEVAYGLMQPNGVGLAPDGSRVYVAETTPGRVWYWEVAGPGKLQPGPAAMGPGGGTLLYGFDGYQLLDSLAVDSAGNVCVATLITGAITMLTPDGEVADIVRVPEYDAFVTNVCFGGQDLRTAYITSSGRGKLYATEWTRPGLRLSYG